MKTYGGMPMTDEVVIVTCIHCDKPMIPSAVKEHRGKCKASAVEPAPAAPTLVIRTDALEKKPDTKTKKRKESVVIEEPETPVSAVEMSPPPASVPEKKPSEKKQKIAKIAKVKPPGRVKGPLDLDKQCGVVPSIGAPPCARSLTCKSHSMSSKRAVEGRSRPYDVLLGMYQKKPMPVKDEKINRDSEAPLADKEDVNVDSDEEYTDLLDAVRSYEPQPLAARPMTYMRRRNNCYRIRDLFLDALKGPCRPIIPSGSAHDQSTMHL
ncbi:SCA7-domain-containing protein [Linnemannia elongata AG-77]|uniref:SCA7-domain-containing protein n=1 Tax=Linnemannia elongata AG-77 TaxID=1314771 RepID=A0A197JXR7_9FUNG|nr:SCA7-domain-containing protein [Linnemannia elongata AG-77]